MGMSRNGTSIALSGSIFLFVVAFLGCSSMVPVTPTQPAKVMKNELSGAPDWLTASCTVFWDDEEDAHICGVGAVTGTANPGLARSAAIARARSEIASSLQTKVERLLKDYQATTTGGAYFGKVAADEQHISDTSKQITAQSVSGTRFEASWVSSSGTYYAMVSLGAAGLVGAINADQTLPENVRVEVAKRAEASFAELAAAVETSEASESTGAPAE